MTLETTGNSLPALTITTQVSALPNVLLPQSVTDAVGNVTTVNDYNWYNLQPVHITDINDNESYMLFDALGLPVAAAMMSKDGSGTNPGGTITGIDPHGSTDITNPLFRMFPQGHPEVVIKSVCDGLHLQAAQ